MSQPIILFCRHCHRKSPKVASECWWSSNYRKWWWRIFLQLGNHRHENWLASICTAFDRHQTLPDWGVYLLTSGFFSEQRGCMCAHGCMCEWVFFLLGWQIDGFRHAPALGVWKSSLSAFVVDPPNWLNSCRWGMLSDMCDVFGIITSGKGRWLSLLSGEGGAGFVVAFVDIGFMGAFTKLYGIPAIHLDPIWVIGFSEMESALDKLIFRFRLEMDASFQTNQNRNKTNNSDIHPFSEKLLDHFF